MSNGNFVSSAPTETHAVARRPDSVIAENGFAPTTFSELRQVAELIVRGGYAPKGATVESVMLSIVKGREVGLPALYSAQNICVINNQPRIWGDAMLALVMDSGKCVYFNEYTEAGKTEDDFACVCEVQRKGFPRKKMRFTIRDAKRAGLWKKPKTPWETYPQRMLQMKPRSWNLRDNFPDVLAGMTATEEIIGHEETGLAAPEMPSVGPAGTGCEPFPSRKAQTETVNLQADVLSPENYQDPKVPDMTEDEVQEHNEKYKGIFDSPSEEK